MQMVLVITNGQDEHAPLVTDKLLKINKEFLRLNTEKFGEEFEINFRSTSDEIAIELLNGKRRVLGKEIRSIWFRRPLLPEPGPFLNDPEARTFVQTESNSFLQGIFRSLNCFWLNHPEAIRTASFKVFQLKAAKELGFVIPKTCISRDPETVRGFFSECNGQMIAKLVSQGPPQAPTVDAQYVVFTSKLSYEDLQSDTALSTCPAIYQEYVPKKYELRVTVVGDQAFACEIHSQLSEQTKIDWRRYDLPNTPHRIHKLTPDLERQCIALTRYFGLSFSAIDLIVTPENYTVFLELNPNGQWGWIEELTGLPISEAIANLLANPPEKNVRRSN